MAAKRVLSRGWGLSVLFLLVGIFAPPIAYGQVTHTWIGPMNGDFDTPANWMPSTPFNPGDTRYMDLGNFASQVFSSFDIHHGRTVQLRDATLNITTIPATGVLDVGKYIIGSPGDGDEARLLLEYGASLTVDNIINIPDLAIGLGGTGTVRVTDGSTISGARDDRGILGDVKLGVFHSGRGGTGALTITNAPSHAGIDAANLYIGDDEDCQGVMNLAGTTAYTYSGETIVGHYGQGELNLYGQALLSRRPGAPTTKQHFKVGHWIDSDGSVILNGTCQLQTDSAYIGMLGRGWVNLKDASVWDVYGDACIGAYGTGDGQLNVGQFEATETATLTQHPAGGAAAHTFCLGSAGTGRLIVRGSSRVSVHDVVIGLQDTGNGSAFLNGSDVRMTCTSLTVRSGWLAIENGARVDYDDSLSTHWKEATIASPVTATNRAAVLIGGGGATLDVRGRALDVGAGDETGGLYVSEGGVVRCGVLTVDSAVLGQDGALVEVGTPDVTLEKRAEVHCADLVVGSFATGKVNLHGGGVVNASDQGYLGKGADSQGTVHILESGASLHMAGPLSVGTLGEGVISVYKGGLLESKDCFIGDMTGSEGSIFVNGAASRWAADGAVVVGQYGKGSLVAESGGEVTATNITAGRYDGGDGFIRVANGSKLTTTTLVVGNEGLGGMYVMSGGQCTINDDAFVGENPGGTGTLTVQGAGTTFLIEDWLSIGNWVPPSGPGQPVGPPGSVVEVSDGALLTVVGNMTLWGDGTLRVKSKAKVTINGDELTFENKSKFEKAYGGTIELLGTNVTIKNDDPADLAGLAGTTLIFAGGDGVLDTIEVCGLGGRSSPDGFHENFTIGKLIVGGDGLNGHVQLIDALANQRGASDPPESLYVKELIVRNGSSIDFGGIDVYCQQIVNEGGTVIPGGASVTQIPAIESADGMLANVQYYTGNPDTPGQGFLSIEDLCDVTIRSGGSGEMFPSSHLQLMTTLVDDRSEAGRADGLFLGGHFALYDVFGTPLWLGDIAELSLVERDDGSGVLDGLAMIELAGGEYSEGFAMPFGQYIEMSFLLDVGDPEDFGGAFGGGGSFAIGPALPEPATLILLSLGGVFLTRRRTSRRQR